MEARSSRRRQWRAIPIRRISPVKRRDCSASRRAHGDAAAIAHSFKTITVPVGNNAVLMRLFRGCGALPVVVFLLTAPMACFGQQATSVTKTTRFEFHSDPWINLHHL